MKRLIEIIITIIKAPQGWWQTMQKYILNMTLLVTLFFFGVFFYWLLWPYNPIRIDEFIVDKETATQGEKVCFYFKGEKLLNMPARVILELVDGEAIEIMRYEANNPVGCILKSRCFNVPYSIMPKAYTIKWTGTYDVNHIRKVRKIVESKPILITENKRLKQFMDGKK